MRMIIIATLLLSKPLTAVAGVVSTRSPSTPRPMAGKITTLAYLPLAKNAPLEPVIAIIKKIEGVVEVYHGRRIEDDGILTLGIDWIPKANKNTMEKSIISGDVNRSLKTCLNGEITIFSFEHTFGSGELLDTVNQPITEIATFYFLPGITDEQIKEFDIAFKAMEKAVLAQPGNFGATAGHTVGLLRNPDIGVDVKAFIANAQWASLEAHVAFSQTPEFGEALGPLIPFLSGNAVSHVAFKKA